MTRQLNPDPQMTSIWQRYSPGTSAGIPAEVIDWIALETSMTARLSQVAGQRIDVEVLRQAEAPLRPDEEPLFGDPAAPALVREVCLSAAGQSLLVARTALTSQALQTHPTIVKLGNTALGSLLFAGPKPCPFTLREFARLRPGDPLYDLVRSRHAPAAPDYWGRRTLFWLFDEPLLVTEIFLPELLALPGTARG